MNVFEVGSHVWYVPAKRPAVYHLLVCEEIVKNTIAGKDIEYVFKNIIGTKSKTISSKNCDGEFFSERSEVFDFLTARASLAINKMLDKQQKEKAPLEQPAIEAALVLDQQSENNDETIVELPDGTKARLKGGIPK